MKVMLFLAAAHISFWGAGIYFGVQAGTLGLPGTFALGVWLMLIGLWLVLVARLSLSGWLTGPGVSSWPGLWVPSPPVVLSIAGLFLLPPLRDAWLAVLAALPDVAIPALNALRVFALGTVMKAWRHEFPRRIGFAVGIPDALFGLWSGVIALSNGFHSAKLELVWNISGLVILLMMIPMVFTVLRQPRLDARGKGPARSILAFPMVLAPAGLATGFAILHVLLLYRVLI